MTNDDLIERLGQAQQKVMSLTVAKRALEKRAEAAEERAEILEELVMDVVADMLLIHQRISKVIKKLDGDR